MVETIEVTEVQRVLNGAARRRPRHIASSYVVSFARPIHPDPDISCEITLSTGAVIYVDDTPAQVRLLLNS